MPIRQLSDQIINQIAAGEVVSRPASVIKELVENSIDAQASRIEISIENGGKTLIQVLDNGEGIVAEELPLAIARHCTSKLNENIHDIQKLGFRGEALPSIGSVAKLKVTSHHLEAKMAAEITVEGGKIFPVRPASFNQGTLVEVRDLFYNIPARLKFMKSDRAEASAISEMIKRTALAYPKIYFLLRNKNKKILEYFAQKSDDADLSRIHEVLGNEFYQNSVYFCHETDNISVKGYCSLPSYNSGNSLNQFCYINQRPIQDKFIYHAIRSAYLDFIPKDRYPYIILFIDINPLDVDVNVHPAKADVRFRDSQEVRSLIIAAIKSGLEGAPARAISTHREKLAKMFLASKALTNQQMAKLPMKPKTLNPSGSFLKKPIPSPSYKEPSLALPLATTSNLPIDNALCEATKPNFLEKDPAYDIHDEHPLGIARAQIHKNYIISQTKDSLILVDQHAAHERIVYEKLKTALYDKPLESQISLIPVIVQLSSEEASTVLEHQKTLEKFGLILENFGANTVLVRETPSLLGQVNAKKLVKDLAQELMEHASCHGLTKALNQIASTMACHGSIRSGRTLKLEEMNALLRDIESTAHAHTCNHGRPTYVELKLEDIEKLFKRR